MLVRYGELRIDPGGNDFFPQLKDPQTWDRRLLTLALGYDLTSYAKLRFEYYILNEETNDITQPSVDDDQMLIQLKFNF